MKVSPKNIETMDIWHGLLMGPVIYFIFIFNVIIIQKATPYVGAYFEFELHLPALYPDEPPQIIFITPIFHPGIRFSFGDGKAKPTGDGQVCIDVIFHKYDQNKWRPAGGLRQGRNF